MVGGVRLNGARAWLALAALLGVGSAAGVAVPAPAWDWQPALAASEPWRAWTAAFVHWSGSHFAANLAALALVAALGLAARVSFRDALAWAIAWPLTHAALALQPALAHYGGLSGVLHAGVAVAATALVLRARGRPRTLGAVILAGLAVKVLSERPWAGPLVHPAGWDIAVAPLAHAAGALSGTLAAMLLATIRPPAAIRR